MEIPLDTLGWGVVGGAIGGAVLVAVMAFVLAIYVYMALAWMTIGDKMKYKHSWLAWIPIANIAMIFQLGGIHWAFIFLMLIPKIGGWAILVLLIIATWKVFEKRKYPGWFSLSLIIPILGTILYMIAIGFVAWKKK